MTRHVVKSWAHFFDAIVRGQKLHDLRKDDRDYRVGDELELCRYDNINGHFTGERCLARITYITGRAVPCAFSSAVLAEGYVILSLKV